MLIGPGLGAKGARAMVERLLDVFEGPVVLDADALNAFARDVPSLARAIGKRAALLTPHPAEFGRLVGLDVESVLAERFELPARLAADAGAAVLLKGVPTVVAAAIGNGARRRGGNAGARDRRRGRRAGRDRRDAARPHRRRGHRPARSPRSRTGAPRRR